MSIIQCTPFTNITFEIYYSVIVCEALCEGTKKKMIANEFAIIKLLQKGNSFSRIVFSFTHVKFFKPNSLDNSLEGRMQKVYTTLIALSVVVQPTIVASRFPV